MLACDPQLSNNLQQAMPAAVREATFALDTTELWLSPISVWEVMLLAEKGRISLQYDTATWIDQSLKSLAICEASLNHQIAILSRQIDLPHQDPADRFIAATALHYQLQLATVDTRLTAATWLPTIS